MKRIKGLDTIRFICATFVLIGHNGLPLPSIFTNAAHPLLVNAGKLISLIFNGPAAVIVFFVISGFCIHYPTLFKQKFNIGQYYAKRLLRIGVPAIAAVIIYKLLHEALTPPQFGIFWSIVCEVVYYILYPGIIYLKKISKASWVPFILISYAVAFTLLVLNKQAVLALHNGYPALGLLTWVVGLPCWLLGCWLAENFSKFKLLSTHNMWLLRGAMLLVGLGLRIIKFHVDSVYASNSYTLDVFAVIACAWLGFEIIYNQAHKPFKFFEWVGQWSYSLYVIHPVTGVILGLLGIATYLNQTIMILACFVVSYVFYFLVEKPSHKLAAYAGANFFKNRGKAVVTENYLPLENTVESN